MCSPASLHNPHVLMDFGTVEEMNEEAVLLVLYRDSKWCDHRD